MTGDAVTHLTTAAMDIEGIMALVTGSGHGNIMFLGYIISVRYKVKHQIARFKTETAAADLGSQTSGGCRTEVRIIAHIN